MSAFIMVVDTPSYAAADAKGNFEIHDVPEGDDTLKVWHESGQISQRKIRVGGSDQKIEIRVQRS